MKQTFLILAAVASVSVFVQSVEAAPITLSTCYTGSCGSITGSIVVNITDDTNENAGTGDLKIVINNLTNGFIDELGLLYQGGLSGNPVIEGFSASGGAKQPTLGLGGCQNDNSGQFLNVCFDYAAKASDRFGAGQTVTFFLDSDTASYLASLFDPTGAFAHVQGLPEGGSVKLTDTPPPPPPQEDVPPVPEPASLTLFGAGLAAVAAARRRRQRRSGTGGA